MSQIAVIIQQKQLEENFNIDEILGEAKALFHIRRGSINNNKKQQELLLNPKPSVNDIDAISKLHKALSKYRFLGNTTSAILGIHQSSFGFRVIEKFKTSQIFTGPSPGASKHESFAENIGFNLYTPKKSKIPILHFKPPRYSKTNKNTKTIPADAFTVPVDAAEIQDSDMTGFPAILHQSELSLNQMASLDNESMPNMNDNCNETDIYSLQKSLNDAKTVPADALTVPEDAAEIQDSDMTGFPAILHQSELSLNQMASLDNESMPNMNDNCNETDIYSLQKSLNDAKTVPADALTVPEDAAEIQDSDMTGFPAILHQSELSLNQMASLDNESMPNMNDNCNETDIYSLQKSLNDAKTVPADALTVPEDAAEIQDSDMTGFPAILHQSELSLNQMASLDNESMPNMNDNCNETDIYSLQKSLNDAKTVPADALTVPEDAAEIQDSDMTGFPAILHQSELSLNQMASLDNESMPNMNDNCNETDIYSLQKSLNDAKTVPADALTVPEDAAEIQDSDMTGFPAILHQSELSLNQMASLDNESMPNMNDNCNETDIYSLQKSLNDAKTVPADALTVPEDAAEIQDSDMTGFPAILHQSELSLNQMASLDNESMPNMNDNCNETDIYSLQKSLNDAKTVPADALTVPEDAAEIQDSDMTGFPAILHQSELSLNQMASLDNESMPNMNDNCNETDIYSLQKSLNDAKTVPADALTVPEDAAEIQDSDMTGFPAILHQSELSLNQMASLDNESMPNMNVTPSSLNSFKTIYQEIDHQHILNIQPISNSQLPVSSTIESVPLQRVNSQGMEEIYESSFGKRGSNLETNNFNSPIKRCRLSNFDVGESLTAIGRILSDNPRFNHFNLKCGEFEFTAKSI